MNDGSGPWPRPPSSVRGMELLAPIVAVTVHPDRARVTRRGRVTLAEGAAELVVAGLPALLIDDSVRVTGRADVPVRVVGVDLVRRDLIDAPDERVRAAEAAVRDGERAVAAVDGTDTGNAAREAMLHRLATRSGDRLAAALADGTAGTARVAEIGGLVATQIADLAASRLANAERRADAMHALHAAREALGRLQNSGRTRRDALIGVEADAEGEVELELSYVVGGASWSPAYDARLADQDGAQAPAAQLALTWFGLVVQTTGEDWPECELTLSTARPAVSATVPELDPWWVDAFRPRVPMPAMAAGPVGLGAAAPQGRAANAVDSFAGAESMTDVDAQVVEGTVAASWRLARPTAVPADGSPHRTTVATLTLPARLDHVTAPSISPDAHLRATVTNTSGQVLLAGRASTFLGEAYVGTASVEQTAPGAEIELALGVDDRVVVERELAERTPHRARFGSTRGAVERWTTTVTNRRATPARVIVRERLPVSRHADIKVVDVTVTPPPGERDELGRVEWMADIAPGGTWEASVRFGVEHPKDMPVVGWR